MDRPAFRIEPRTNATNAERSGRPVPGDRRTARERRSGAGRRSAPLREWLSRWREEIVAATEEAGGRPIGRESVRSGLRGLVSASVTMEGSEEEKLVDLAKGPARPAERDPGEERRQIGRLVRRQSPHLEVAVRRPRAELRRRGRSGRRDRGGGDRPRRGRGGRCDGRRRAGARRATRLPMLSTRPTCHGSPVHPVLPRRACLRDHSVVRPDRRSGPSDPSIGSIWCGCGGIFDLVPRRSDDPPVPCHPVLPTTACVVCVTPGR